MAKVLDAYLLDIGPTPREIKTLRREIADFHLKLGKPVIYKHRWNLQDAQNGLTSVCPKHDVAYERDKTDCPYCFGTGFTGGFADAVILFVTIADTPADQLKIDKQGYVLFDKHPHVTIPWYPLVGDGDMIIDSEFDRATWEVLSTGDRYELNDVTPVSVRGPFGMQWTDYTIYRVQQTSTMDRLPNLHAWYNVPVEFNYDSVPIIYPPFGLDIINPFKNVSITSVSFFLTGQEGFLSTSDSINFYLTGGGTTAQQTFAYRLTGGSTANVVLDVNETATSIIPFRVLA